MGENRWPKALNERYTGLHMFTSKTKKAQGRVTKSPEEGQENFEGKYYLRLKITG
jgi:hypothetical protein